METIGLLLFSSLFVYSGFSHILNHKNMVGYTASSLGNCPLVKPLSFLGGAPTGLFLIIFGAGAALSQLWAIYGLAGFLAVVTVLFHRNFRKDPGGFKTISLLGSALYIAATMV